MATLILVSREGAEQYDTDMGIVERNNEEDQER